MAPRNRSNEGRDGLFGFLFPRKPEPPTIKTFAPPTNDDGAVIVAAGSTQGAVLDVDNTVKTEADLIGRYRQMSLQPEVDRAIGEIVDEAIVVEDGEETVEIVLDDLDVSDPIKKVITNEFNEILNILDFHNMCHELFRRWYVDGRLYFHVIIDDDNPGEGVKELRWIDARKIRKVKEVGKFRDPKTNAIIQKVVNEYYIYNDMGLNFGSRIMSSMGTEGIRIAKDSILHVPSGATDLNQSVGISYLHYAMREMNQLRQLEDSTMIYFLSRAPERRIFYIDIGNLPKMKAEQYVRDIMTKQKNKISYDAATGEVRDDRKFMTMNEDFFFPVRDGERGTKVEPLSGGTQLPDLLQAVEAFTDKLYRALQVPISRLKPDTLTSLGRATEVTRDEVKFSKFIDKLRMKFSQIFMRSLQRQLVLKGICTTEDWELMRKDIRFRWLRDNYFAELKEREIILDRLTTLQLADPYIFKYFSPTWVRKYILMQTDEEMYEMDLETEIDLQNPLYSIQTGMFEEPDDPMQQSPTAPKPVPKKKPKKDKPKVGTEPKGAKPTEPKKPKEPVKPKDPKKPETPKKPKK